MKKLMFGLVGALAMVASAEVESSNIVGFDTKEVVTGNFNMFSVPFGATDGNGFSLNKNIQVENGTAGEGSSSSDQIRIWNPATSGYDFWYLYEGDDEYPAGWYNAGSEDWFDDAYPQGLPAGTAFWYLAKDSAAKVEITFSGEVNNNTSLSFPIVKGNFNMLANPFPIPFSLNENLEIANGTAGVGSSDSDQIRIWNAKTSGYEFWYLYEGDEEYPAGWYNAGSEDWFDDAYPQGLPVGTAFWYLAVAGEGSATATFKK